MFWGLSLRAIEKRAKYYCNVDYLRKTCCGSYGCPINELLEIKEYCTKDDDIEDMMCQVRYRCEIRYLSISCQQISKTSLACYDMIYINAKSKCCLGTSY